MALTFLSRRAAGLVRSNNVAMTRMFSSEAAEASGNMSFSFNLPHESIYLNAKVAQVIVPGAGGEYGVTADHVPTVAQLKPGVLQIMHGDGSDAEKFFVSGGFALTHANSATVRYLSLDFVLKTQLRILCTLICVHYNAAEYI